jgi:uncharacterized protein (DUF433 family)
VKAIRGLPEDEQGILLAYLLDRALTNDPSRASTPRRSGEFGLTPALVQSQPVPLASWPRFGVSLLLNRLAAGASVDELGRELGLGPDVLGAALRDLARRSPESEPAAAAFKWLAEGGRLDERAAQELGLTVEQLRDALEPTDALIDTATSAIAARAAIPGPPVSSALGQSPQGPLRTMPVRFPEPLYERLRAWSEEHNFPMAVVVRGLVERFLDEQQRRSA